MLQCTKWSYLPFIPSSIVDVTRGIKEMRKILMAFAAVATVAGAGTPALAKPHFAGLSGVASWYGPGFHGRRTASGERFNTHALTAAHRSLPFGTRVRVLNKRNGRSVVV